MPRPVRAVQRQLSLSTVLKLFAAVAVLALCLLGIGKSSSGRVNTASSTYADSQISKLDTDSVLLGDGSLAGPHAKPDEPTTAEIVHAVDTTQSIKSVEQGSAETAALQTDTREVSRQADLAQEAEASRQAELAAERVFVSRQADFVQNLVYFNDPAVMANVGCPNADFSDVHRNYTCFYQDKNIWYKHLPKSWRDKQTGCAAIFKPLPADFGRPWCVLNTAAVNLQVEAALQRADAAETLHLGKTLLLGTLSGPNPTHQLNIHFYHIYVWMKKNNIKMGDLEIIADCHDPSRCLGTYGIGLAKAFGTLRFLPQLPPVTIIDEAKLSLDSFGFPFDIHKYELDKTLDCSFLELTWAVKQFYGVDPQQPANPNRVVISVRKPHESRALSNVADLHSALQSKGYNVSLVTFGDLTFQQQLMAVADASVLVGVTGSDLVNLVFLPFSGSVVEIFPVAQGKQVFTPELWNLAHMVGKNHLKYVSPFNSTLVTDSEGRVIGDRPVHQSKATDVHVAGLVALVEAAALAAALDNVVWNRMSIEPHASGNGARCWDRTQTRKLMM